MTASNRAGMVYAGRLTPAELAAPARRQRRPSTSCSSARATRRSRAATARSCASTAGAAGAAATRRSSTTRTGRERAWAALANPNAGELLVSAAAGWEFADLAGRHHAGGGPHGSLARRRLRGADADRRRRARCPARSPTSLPAVARALRRRAAGVRARRSSERERRRGARRAPAPARASPTSACSRRWPRVPRELFVPERAAGPRVRRRGAADRARADDLAAVHGRDDLRAARAATADERVLDVGTGSGYQAAVLAELAAEVVTIERVPELAEQARADARRGRATAASTSASATARSASRTARRSTRSRSPPPRPACPRRSTSSSRRAAGSSSRSGSRRDQLLELVVRSPRRAGGGALGPRAASCRSSAQEGSPSSRPVALAGALLRSARRAALAPRSARSDALARTRAGARPAAQLAPAREVLRRRRERATSSTSPSTRCSCTAPACTTCSRPPARSSSR